MRHQVQQAGIALQIVTQISFFINNFLQIIYAGSIIAAAKLKHGNFIVEYQHPVAVNENCIVF